MGICDAATCIAHRPSIQCESGLCDYEQLRFRDDCGSYGKTKIGVDFPDVDFAAIARSCKCFGERVTKPGEVAEAVRAALDQNKPAVVDVVIDKHQVMKGTIYSPLAKEALSGIEKVLPAGN